MGERPPAAVASKGRRGLRQASTRYGTRVYYHEQDVPGVICEAGEMFFEPFRGWIAWLRHGATESDAFEVACRIRRRLVFKGYDHDLSALLKAFQHFMDECRDDADHPEFECRVHSPSQNR